MNGPKVHREPLLSAMAGSASGYMLEHLENPVVLDKSENPSGADNQQERLSADWVVGFVDGEGCFFVGINRQPSMKLGWASPSRVSSGAARERHYDSRTATKIFRIRFGHYQSW